MIGVLSYLTFFLTMAGIMAIITLGLNLQWGYTGLFNGGVVAFFGAGAYGTMMLADGPNLASSGASNCPIW
jgi:branched-chain amino acid transport system permease protein